jgi:hypothetical protein
MPKNGAKEELARIEPLISCFPLSELDLDFLARKFQIKVHNHCKTVNCAYAYHYILLSGVDDSRRIPGVSNNTWSPTLYS